MKKESKRMNFSVIAKEEVPILEAFRFYGVPPDQHGFVRCPFHGEKTPSLKVYPQTNSFYCFGCGAHGDVIDFVKKQFGIPFKEALFKLNIDFNLGLPLGNSMDKKQLQELRKRADELNNQRMQIAKERKELLNRLNDAMDRVAELEKIKETLRPTDLCEPFEDAFVNALVNLPKAYEDVEIAQIKLRKFEEKHGR